MLKLIIFDCDGVMFDSRETNRVYYNDLLAAFHCPPMDENELSFVHMHNVTTSVEHIFRNHDFDLEEVHTFRKNHDYTPYLDHMIIEPDLIDFLEQTKKQYQLAISTNRTNTTLKPLLKAFELDSYFSRVVTSGDIANPKPAPDALLDILSFCHCTPEEAVYIGDSPIDYHHAQSAGIPLIAFRNNTLEAAYHVNCFMDILQLQPFR
ncbi:MAG: beta-phosphoglucomutase [Proteobacteria bacterium]|nr:MAG: beta-phosphoglucomutase [Pseudomonadota bacterium]PIE65300.1 MAG: beta-phosphoglucomutase [Desulfobacterales bacterium]